MAYLGQLRAEHAAVLLLHSDEPVTSIGRAVGWPDQSGFARRFKAHYGLSATTYRKRFATRAAHLHHPVTAASLSWRVQQRTGPPSSLTWPLSGASA
jgi:AraC-like DNA-binding protein